MVNIFEIIIYFRAVAKFDLVHDVEAMHYLRQLLIA